MSIRESLQQRRSVYGLKKKLPVSMEAIRQLVTETTELVPDAFNMHSQRVVLALGERHDALWDAVYDAFGGIAREPEPKEKEDITKRVIIAE